MALNEQWKPNPEVICETYWPLFDALREEVRGGRWANSFLLGVMLIVVNIRALRWICKGVWDTFWWIHTWNEGHWSLRKVRIPSTAGLKWLQTQRLDFNYFEYIRTFVSEFGFYSFYHLILTRISFKSGKTSCKELWGIWIAVCSILNGGTFNSYFMME